MRLRVLVGLLVLALSVLVAACGDDDDGGGGESSAEKGEELTKIKVGALPTTAAAPIFMGVDRGFFEEEGLDVEMEVLGSGAVIFPSLMSGSLQFSFTGASSVVMARSKGLPIKIVVDVGTSNLAPVLVPKDSDVKSFADLRDKTVGVTSLGNVSEFSMLGALDEAGVKRDQVKLLEVPYADGQTALERGSVAAVWSSPPFSTRMLETGKFRSIGTAIGGELLGLGDSVFGATEEYLEKNPETAEKFARAVTKSTQYADAHSDEVLETISNFMEIEPGLLGPEDVKLEVGKVRLDRLAKVHDFLVELGYVKEPVDVNDTMWKAEWAVSG